MRPRRWTPLSLGGFLLLVILAGLTALPALSAAPQSPRGQEGSPTPPPEQLNIPNETCLACHGQPNISMTLENGEVWGLYVPQEVYDHSVHGEQGYACVQCHSTVGDYPHPPFTAADSRDATLQLTQVCARCHGPMFELVQDSVHEAALQAGNRNAAVCADCHGAHAVQRLKDAETNEPLPDSRAWIPQTCAKCHYAIYQMYSTSVHGSALLEEGNPDVPTCIDCHGVHSIEDPSTTEFRLSSPQICAGCHTDPSIMDKYGVSTQVLDTYVADFHGTTVTLFEKQHPDQETNEAVCFDCHGVHNILSVSDPEKGLQVRQNLLLRCQECHPDANENFPAAWLSHYIPSPTRHPLVYIVNLFYSFFIPGVLGGMAILVALDAFNLLRGRRPKPFPHPEVQAAGPVAVFPADLPSALEDPGATVEAPAEETAKEAMAEEALVEETPAEEAPPQPLVEAVATPPMPEEDVPSSEPEAGAVEVRPVEDVVDETQTAEDEADAGGAEVFDAEDPMPGEDEMGTDEEDDPHAAGPGTRPDEPRTS